MIENCLFTEPKTYMNEYLKVFEAINYSVDQLLTNQYLSPEINESALNLRQKLQPCFQNIRQAATLLDRSIQPCLAALNQAEDIWYSKPKVIDVSTLEICEHIGELSGRAIRISKIGEKYQLDIVNKLREAWRGKINALRNKWFNWNEKEQKLNKDAINVFDKDALLKSLQTELNFQSNTVILSITNGLNLIYQELQSILSYTLQSCLDSLETESRDSWQSQIEATVEQIELKFKRPIQNLPKYYVKSYSNTINIPVQSLAQKSAFGVSLINFNECCINIENIFNNMIIAIFTERIKLANETIEKAIFFYNSFLEKQSRYREETPTQRQIEKVWIEQQRQEIQKIQQGIENILTIKN